MPGLCFFDLDEAPALRRSFLRRRRDALAVIVGRAQARGDLPGTLTRDTVADIVFGVIWYRLLASREPFGDSLASEIARTLAAPGGNVPAACAATARTRPPAGTRRPS